MRFGNIIFQKSEYLNPALSPNHLRQFIENYIGPVRAVISMLETDPNKLEIFREEITTLLSEYFRDNGVVQTYLMTKAKKL